jgi:hypothetical protein
MRSIAIVLLCIVAAILYGIAHDNVTARVCVEYFTIGHPPLIPSESPTALAFAWGVVATWWVGLILGIPLAIVARAGSRPKLAARDLVRPIGILFVATACASLVAGIAGNVMARAGAVWLVEPLASAIPRAKHVAFLTDLWAHLCAYACGFLGGIIICIWAWRERARRADPALRMGSES